MGVTATVPILTGDAVNQDALGDGRVQGFDAIPGEQGEDEVEPNRVEMPLKTGRPARVRPKAAWLGIRDDLRTWFVQNVASNTCRTSWSGPIVPTHVTATPEVIVCLQQ